LVTTYTDILAVCGGFLTKVMCGGKKKKEKAAGEHHIRAKRTGEYIGQGKSQIRCGLMCLASCIKTEAIEGHLLCAFYVLSMPSSCCTHSRL